MEPLTIILGVLLVLAGLALAGLYRLLSQSKSESQRATAEANRKDILLREAEERLNRECDLMQGMMNIGHDSMYIKDAQGRFLRANQSGAVFLNLKSPQEMTGKSDADFFPPEIALQYRKEEEEILRTGKPVLDRVDKGPIIDGHQVWVSITKAPIYGRDGKLLGIVGINRNITERKVAEDSLARERDFLNTLMVNIPDQIYFKDNESRFVKINPATARVLGIASVDAAVGKTDADFFALEDASAFRIDDMNVIASGKPLLDRIECALLNGSDFWMSTTKAPIFDQHSRAIGVVGISRDITDRKKAEKALQDIVSSARCILWDARVKKVGARFVWDMKVQPSDLTRSEFGLANENDGVAWINHIPGEFRQEMHRVSHEALNRGADGYQQEFPFLAADGTMHWLKEEVKVSRLRSGDMHLVGVCVDITDRKRAQLLLENVVARAKCVLWNAEVQDKDGELVWDFHLVSAGTSGQWLAKNSTLDGDNWSSHLDPEDVVEMNKVCAEAVRGGQRGYAQEYRMRGSDKIIRWMSENVEITPKGPGRWDLVGVVVDITERKQAQEVLQQVIKRAQCLLWNAEVQKTHDGLNWDFNLVSSGVTRSWLGVDIKPERVLSIWNDHVEPADMREMDRRSQEAFLTGAKGYSQEFRIRGQDDKIYWMSENVEITLKSPGKWNAVGVVIDITPRKIIERQLEVERDLLQALMDNIPDSIYFKDIHLRFIRMNQHQSKFIGLGAPGLAIGKTDFDFYPEELATEFRKDEEHMIRTGTGISNKIERQSINGAPERWTLTSKVPYRGVDGRIQGLVGVSKDITEIKKMERALSDANEQLNKLAREDSLTGLLNRRMTLDLARNEWARWVRYAKPFSILMIDADNFKTINDRFGHLTGDQALRLVSKNLLLTVRTVDVVGRYGGEEFVVILPETALEGAVAAGQKIVQQIGEADLQINGCRVPLTVSVGVACANGDDKDLDTLLHRADMALYAAKQQGKNRAVSQVVRN